MGEGTFGASDESLSAIKGDKEGRDVVCWKDVLSNKYKIFKVRSSIMLSQAHRISERTDGTCQIVVP